MSEVFISSSEETATLAAKLAADLEQRGFQTLLPSRDIKEGADFPAIAKRLTEADAFVVVVVSNPKRSTRQEREWFAVLNEASDLKKHKKLIPLVVGEGDPPSFLKNWEELRIREPEDPKRWHKLIETISNALRSNEKPKFKPLRKTDLIERERRLGSIASMAKLLKSLGF